MNNNQDNLNINSEMNNVNNANLSNGRFFNNQNGFINNQQEPLNVIPQQQPVNSTNNMNQGFINNQTNNIIPNQENLNNNFNNNQNNNLNNNFNSNINNNPYNNNSNSNFNNNIDDEITSFQNQNQNKFITENQTNTALNDLNIDGAYNGLNKVDYSQDPKVIKNIETQKKKNTITITGEAKVFLIIIFVLLIFTFVMPTIFDFIRDIQ